MDRGSWDDTTPHNILMAGNDAILVPRRKAAELLGMGVRTFDRLRAAGLIGPSHVKLGGLHFYRVVELRAWCEAGCPNRELWRERGAIEEAHGNAD